MAIGHSQQPLTTGHEAATSTSTPATRTPARAPGKRTRTEIEAARARALRRPVDTGIVAPEAPDEQGEILEAEGIDPSDKSRLLEVARSTVGEAYPAFLDACNTVRDLDEKLRQKKTSHWIFDLLLEVVAGMFLPGISAKISATVLNTIFPPSVSDATHRIALKLVETNAVGQLVSQAAAVGKAQAKSAWATLAADAGANTPRSQFFLWLKDSAYKSIGALLTTIDDLRDEQLLAVYIAYHPSRNSGDQMRAQIAQLLARFDSEVEPMGERRESLNMAYNLDHKLQAFIVLGPPHGVRLALLERTSTELAATGKEITSMPVPGRPNIETPARYKFKSWISNELAPFAIERTKALGGGPDYVAANEVEDLPR